MPITISPTIADITIAGFTWHHSDWENNTPGTISGIANAINTQIIALDSVGLVTVTLADANYTLSGDEATNIVFRINGAITANRAVVWPNGWVGIAEVLNQTTGGHDIVIQHAAGATVTIPYNGSGTCVSDGTNFYLVNGIARVGTGAKVFGDLDVVGAGSFGTLDIDSDTTVTGDITVNNLDATGDLNVGGDLDVAGDSTFHGTVYAYGDVNVLAISAQTLVVGAWPVSFSGLDNGGINVAATGEQRSHFRGGLSQASWLAFDKGLLLRWLVGQNNDTESGADRGANFDIVRFGDDGETSLGIPFRILRDSGVIVLDQLPTSNPGVAKAIFCDTTDGNRVKFNP